MNKAPIFSLVNVSYSVKEKEILKSISLDIYPNVITCITGPSGSGKTTFIRLLNGLHSPTSGTIQYLNQSLENYDFRKLRKKVGMVFQTPVIISGTIKDNLTLSEKWHKTQNQLDRTYLTSILEKVGLDSLSLDQDAKDLSGGEQQRITFARVLINQPSVLLLDEPTANLDANQADRILDLIQSLTKEYHLTTIMISHDEMRVHQYGERFLKMTHGELTEV